MARRTQLERRQETQESVLAAAVHCFGEKGYNQCSLEDIAGHCDLTIRPIYHYFGNKKQLFAAATEHLEQQLADALTQGFNANDEFQKHGWSVFIAASRNPHFRQVVLMDAPQILGRERWANSVVIQAIAQLIRQIKPDIGEAKIEILLRVLVAALAEVALFSANLQNDDQLHIELETMVDRLFKSLMQF